jgi:hypothetical protein
MPLIVVLSLPFLAAAGHYGSAAMRQASDLPNLPMAMIGGGIAGGLACLLAIGAVGLLGVKPNGLAVGLIFAGLAGEYLGGRVDDVRSALVRGILCALTLFPAGAALMAALLSQVS